MYHINSKVDKPDIAGMAQRLTELMERGIAVVDMQLARLQFTAERDELSTDIQVKYGIRNPNSARQIVEYMELIDSPEVYEVCNTDGKWTTNKNVLEDLALLGYEFASDILEYRRLKKYVESIESLMKYMDENGRVHPIISLAKTNRVNYREPALMNIPKALLWNIIAPIKPENVLISADIKNQEPNILINLIDAASLKMALLSKDGLYEYLFKQVFKQKAVLNIYVTNGMPAGPIKNSELAQLGYVPPIYYTPKLPSVESVYIKGKKVKLIDVSNICCKTGTTSIEFPDTVTIETVDGKHIELPVNWGELPKKFSTKEGIVTITGEIEGINVVCEGLIRKEFKTAWNALTYGASETGVVAMCKKLDARIIYKYFTGIPELKKYRTLCSQQASAGISSIKTFFGTQLQAVAPGEYMDTKRLKRSLMDLPIQGTGADILSLLIKHCEHEIEKLNLKGLLSIYYTRHDEIVFEADAGLVEDKGIEEVKNIIRDMVEHQIDDWEPFKVEVNQIIPGKLEHEMSDDTEDILD